MGASELSSTCLVMITHSFSNFLAFVSEAVKKKEKASKSKAEFKQKLYKKVNETEDALKERIEELGELS